MTDWTVTQGDCLDVLRTLDDASVDAVVTDPPYGLSFMGKAWDNAVPSVEVWRECLRVLKPGGHLLAFAGTRTQHRMACAIEDAGFEIRDMIAWTYGSGFPKSLDVSKAIDAAAGAEREVVGRDSKGRTTHGVWKHGEQTRFGGCYDITAPATEPAKQWQGWGTALKPALEPITVARKPFSGTVAANVLEHGTGAINVDGARVSADEGRPLIESRSDASLHAFGNGLNGSRDAGTTTQGRWPANLIHDGSAEVMAVFPETGASKAAPRGALGKSPFSGIDGSGRDETNGVRGHDDNGGSAARFFYCAKASKADREEGLDSIEMVSVYCDAWEDEDQRAVLRVDTAQSPPRVIGVSGAECSDVTAWSTLLFGSPSTAPSLMDSKSTIETGSNSTTGSRTLNWLLRLSTSACTADVRSETGNGGSLAASADRGTPSLTITSGATVSARGVEPAASRTRWTISASGRSPADHPTVKPTDLMRYLCRLVTPPNGLVLDPFTGSGSTGRGAILEGFRFHGIELDPDYAEIARKRIEAAVEQRYIETAQQTLF